MNAETKTTHQLWLIFTLCVFVILVITLGVFFAIVLVLAQMGRLSDITSAGQTLPILFSLIASLPIGTALTLVFIRIPLKPMYKVIEGMNRLASGHFDHRVKPGKIGPYRELAESFNTLANELEHTEMLRSDFINHFSHEFKTPIVSIRGFARLLRRGGIEREKEEEYLDVIVDESSRLASMATNVLSLTKVENQHILSHVETFHLSEQIRRCILMLEKKWEHKQLDMQADLGEYQISGDPALLEAVWLNLLDNAIKFSPACNQVSITAYGVGDSVRVSIVNHGPAIPKEDQPYVFNKFWQGDSSHTGDGSGIGLAIVRQIIRLHKGSVELESDEEQTVFTVLLPKVHK